MAAFTGGNQGGGLIQTDPGIQPIIPSNIGTLAAGTPGSAFSGVGLNADFQKIVTALVVRNVIDNLRDRAVFAQEGNMYLKASHVEGTNQFVYTGFADLKDAVELLEGVPPETEKMLFDTFSFTGKQMGKTTAITDLAEIFSPFDLYAKASEKLAWNAIDYIEKTLGTLIQTAPALTPTALPAPAVTGYARGIVDAVTQMKRRNVPMYPDNTYHGFAAPETLARIMTETGELGWTDTKKYATPSDILNGEMGLFRGVRFMESNRIGVVPVVVDKIILTGPDAFAAGDFQTIQAYRVGRGGDHADPLAQRAIMGWKGMMGYTMVGFDGAPAGYEMGPASNKEGFRAYSYTLTAAA